ncbi:MAG: phosphoglycerate dehydrogenase [Anaerovoracaceae bacterium]
MVHQKTPHKVVILSRTFGKASDDPINYLHEHGIEYELVRNDRPEDYEWIAEKIGDADAVITGSDVINRYVMDHCPNLRVICKHGVGLDNIDLRLAKERGIGVKNTPDANNESVADLTVLIILALLRGFLHNAIKSSTPDWKAKMLTNDLYGKTVGLIGFGKIGSSVAKRLVGFDTTILVYDPYIESEAIVTANTFLCDFDEVLSRSDIVSLHLPLDDSTYNIIDYGAIMKMKDGAIIINTSRGCLIDNDALYNALKSGKLKGAGLDVFPVEPPVNDPLLTLDNVVATPHIAPHTVEANYRMGMGTSRNVVSYLTMLDKQKDEIQA